MSQLWNGLLSGLGTALSLFYDLIPSFGIAIMLLTVVVNLVVFPLTLKQTRATRAFQKIQPEVKRIQRELKEDPKAMQAEMIKVQREAGANPGGCLLPILVQMPVWFALFRVLNAPLTYIPAGSGLARLIESGGDHFLGMDLGTRVSQAVSDAASSNVFGALPYLALMALMVVAQFVQTAHAQPRLATASTDPQQRTQQKLTRIMPLFFAFISYNFPAGLVLYWTTSNIFRLLQQVLIFRMDGRPETMLPPAPTPAPAPAPEPPAVRPQPPSNKKKSRRRK